MPMRLPWLYLDLSALTFLSISYAVIIFGSKLYPFCRQYSAISMSLTFKSISKAVIALLLNASYILQLFLGRSNTVSALLDNRHQTFAQSHVAVGAVHRQQQASVEDMDKVTDVAEDMAEATDTAEDMGVVGLQDGDQENARGLFEIFPAGILSGTK